MKIALYIEDGLEQIVLTPETATEKAILDKAHDETRGTEIKRGSFYGCQGGWIRHRDYSTWNVPSSDYQGDTSTMIVLREKKP